MLGVTGALFGGAVAASAILHRNLVGAVTRPALLRLRDVGQVANLLPIGNRRKRAG